MKHEILFLNQEDVIEAGILNMGKILELVEKVFYSGWYRASQEST